MSVHGPEILGQREGLVLEDSTLALDAQKCCVEEPEVAAPLRRMRPAEIQRRLDVWREDVLSSREKLLTVRLNANGPLAVSIPYLSEQTGVNKVTLATRNAMPDVIEAMRRERIILPGYMSSECEKRRKLLRWYEGLSEQEKQSIPLFGNKVKQRGYLDQVPELKGLFTTSLFHLVSLTLDEINEDLIQLGVASSDYKTTQERGLERALSQSMAGSKISPAKRLIELRALSVATVADLSTSTDIPFTPVLHLFAAASLESHSHSGYSNYYTAWKSFTRYLTLEGHQMGDSVKSMLGEHTLTRFRKYLASQLQGAQMSTSTASMCMSCTRKMLERAKFVQGLGLEEFYAAPGFDVVRETDKCLPYSPAERNRISEAVQASIARTHSLLQPYVRSGVGEDPYDEHGKSKRGLVPLEAARWIFENKFDCVPINFVRHDKIDKYHKYFKYALLKSRLSIYEVYESWGYLYGRPSRILAPYIARLAQVTGLNAESIASLEIDDFVTSHPLSQRPCLRYWKERSTGEKEYHLDVFKADISWLTSSQAKEIKKIFDDVIYLTSEFRGSADPSISNHLFIYQVASGPNGGEIKSLSGSNKSLSTILKAFAVNNNLLTDAGEPLSLTPSRFRPSFVSELIEQGVSVREIQVILGHENIDMTLRYLDRLDFNRVAREKLDVALRKIHAETISDKPVAPVVDVLAREGVIFKTPTGGCRNILNPPDFIKKLRGYVPGKPCSLYNKCLSCENSILTKSDLPELFAMQRDYMHILHVNRVADTPYGSVVLENLAILKSILTPESSDFSTAELEEAERLSEYVDTNIAIEGVGL